MDADLFKEEMAKLDPMSKLWLRGESERAEWRKAHKVLEWDGWEEGLVLQALGLEEQISPNIGLLRLL